MVNAPVFSDVFEELFCSPVAYPVLTVFAPPAAYFFGNFAVVEGFLLFKKDGFL